jgi:hypothetical protein
MSYKTLYKVKKKRHLQIFFKKINKNYDLLIINIIKI